MEYMDYRKIETKFEWVKNECPDNLKESMYATLLNKTDDYKRKYGEGGSIEALRKKIRYELDVLIGKY